MPVDASCYSMNVRCDNLCDLSGDGPSAGQFIGRNERECFRQGRENGWRFKRSSRTGIVLVLCPHCVKRGHGRDWNWGGHS